jgi:DNA-binding CsgD family transcriptional regulator
VYTIAMDSFSPLQTLIEKRTDPGFLMLSSTMHVLHWDRRAWELCRNIATPATGDADADALPGPITDFAHEILNVMGIRRELKDWEQFQVRRVIKNGQDSIFLSGIGLPDPGGLDDSRVLIILEQIKQRQGFSLERAKERFHFTGRETEVIAHLMKGWTNKEIANAINISEMTVKEHIKHIMDKTSTSTRTGILVQILQG